MKPGHRTRSYVIVVQQYVRTGMIFSPGIRVARVYESTYISPKRSFDMSTSRAVVGKLREYREEFRMPSVADIARYERPTNKSHTIHVRTRRNTCRRLCARTTQPNVFQTKRFSKIRVSPPIRQSIGIERGKLKKTPDGHGHVTPE